MEQSFIQKKETLLAVNQSVNYANQIKLPLDDTSIIL